MIARISIAAVFLCVFATAAATRAAEPHVQGPRWNESRGMWQLTVTSRFQQGPNVIEVLLPDGMDTGKPHRVLYVLPVETGIGGRYGDGLQEIRKLDLHNRHGLICVAPAFDTIPWFMDHATDPKRRHESYMTSVVVPLIESRYKTPGTRDGRLLVGFSKSGWGAFTLLLRHPDFFGYAASWDAPLMQQEANWQSFGIAQAAGTIDTFRQYQPSRLFAAHAKQFQDEPRFVLTGYKSFGPNGGKIHTDSHMHTRWAHETMRSLGIRHTYNNRLTVDHAWNTGWLEPAVDALMENVRSGRQSGWSEKRGLAPSVNR